MNVRVIVTVVLVVLAFFAGAFWQKTTGPAPHVAETAPESVPHEHDQAMAPEIATGEPSAVGIKWDVPGHWKDRGATSMRLATYDVPAAGGGEGGECAVFYFGPSQGGGVEDNIDRWIGMFTSHGKIDRASRTADGMSVKLVQVEGSYDLGAGTMSGASGIKEGYMLKGAIVEGPNGNVFFKFTGPKKVLEAAAKDFDGMLASLRKG